MHRLLFVTDDSSVCEALQADLSQAGYTILPCSPSPEALPNNDSARPPEVVLWDFRHGLAPLSELPTLLRLEKESPVPPVLLLVPEEHLPVLPTPLPAEDFLPLPLRPHEARLRLSFLLGQKNGVESDQTLRFNGVVMDFANYTVQLDGERLTLTHKEFELLRFLATHRGRAFSRQALLQQIWGYDYYGGIRTVDVHIRRLRVKLGNSHQDLIETVRNVGYRFAV